VLEKFNKKHESIDNANIHLHAKLEDERKILQGETKKEINKDIIGSGALFTSMSNPHPDFLFFVFSLSKLLFILKFCMKMDACINLSIHIFC